MKPVIIMGAGGHAKVLINILLLNNQEIIGIVDPNKEVGNTFMGCTILGSDETLGNYLPEDIELVNGIGSVPDTNLRWKIDNDMRQTGFKFCQVIHPSAIISKNVTLEDSVQIMAGVIIQPDVYIGKSCIINTGSIIDHDCVIGENCHVAPGVTLSGNVDVGKNTHIGTGTSIIQGISIGESCVIAAG